MMHFANIFAKPDNLASIAHFFRLNIATMATFCTRRWDIWVGLGAGRLGRAVDSLRWGRAGFVWLPVGPVEVERVREVRFVVRRAVRWSGGGGHAGVERVGWFKVQTEGYRPI